MKDTNRKNKTLTNRTTRRVTCNNTKSFLINLQYTKILVSKKRSTYVITEFVIFYEQNYTKNRNIHFLETTDYTENSVNKGGIKRIA